MTITFRTLKGIVQAKGYRLKTIKYISYLQGGPAVHQLSNCQWIVEVLQTSNCELPHPDISFLESWILTTGLTLAWKMIQGTYFAKEVHVLHFKFRQWQSLWVEVNIILWDAWVFLLFSASAAPVAPCQTVRTPITHIPCECLCICLKREMVHFSSGEQRWHPTSTHTHTHSRRKTQGEGERKEKMGGTIFF